MNKGDLLAVTTRKPLCCPTVPGLVHRGGNVKGLTVTIAEGIMPSDTGCGCKTVLLRSGRTAVVQRFVVVPQIGVDERLPLPLSQTLVT